MNEFFCGSSCVKFILDKYGKKDENLNKKMEWATELAIYLKQNGFNHMQIFCYKSNLYNDYKKRKEIDINFKGFNFIQKCENLNIFIEEKKLTKKELKKEINENEYIILCVKSSKLNHDRKMIGGHFIILNGFIKNKVNIIIPRKNEYEYQIESLGNIIKYCQKFGAWRILLKGGEQ